MKVFISWSGNRSKKVAEILHDWIPDVVQTVEPFFSSRGIESGAGWIGSMNNELACAKAGIICLTRENLNNPWILFEAGALAKGVDQNLVCPFLLDLPAKDVPLPLGQFQCATWEKPEIHKLLRTLNNAVDDKKLDEMRLQRLFDQNFERLKSMLKAVAEEIEEPSLAKVARSADEILGEILANTRKLLRQEGGRATCSSLFDISWPGPTTNLDVVARKMIIQFTSEYPGVDLTTDNSWSHLSEYARRHWGNVYRTKRGIEIRMEVLKRAWDYLQETSGENEEAIT